MDRRKGIGAWFAPFLERLSVLQKSALSIATLYFAGQSVICGKLILKYYGSLEDQWRVIFASLALAMSLLFVVAPFIANIYLRRRESEKR